MSNKYLEKAASIASKVGKFAKDLTGENVRTLKHQVGAVEALAQKVRTTSAVHAHSAIASAKNKPARVLAENARHRNLDENVGSNVKKFYQQNNDKLDKAVNDRNKARLATGSAAAAVGATGLGVVAKKYLDKKNAK